MTTIFQCKLIKSAIYRINKEVHPNDRSGKYDCFVAQFPHIHLDHNKFYTYLSQFTSSSAKRKVSKQKLMETFLIERWHELDNKASHTLHECQPCKKLFSI